MIYEPSDNVINEPSNKSLTASEDSRESFDDLGGIYSGIYYEKDDYSEIRWKWTQIQFFLSLFATFLCYNLLCISLFLTLSGGIWCAGILHGCILACLGLSVYFFYAASRSYYTLYRDTSLYYGSLDFFWCAFLFFAVLACVSAGGVVLAACLTWGVGWTIALPCIELLIPLVYEVKLIYKYGKQWIGALVGYCCGVRAPIQPLQTRDRVAHSVIGGLNHETHQAQDSAEKNSDAKTLIK